MSDPKPCPCGCGKTVRQTGKRGRPKKFFNWQCHNRFHARLRTEIVHQAKKNGRLVARAEEAAEKNS